MSAVAKHAHEESHPIHWKARIITKEQDSISIKSEEALVIQRTEKRSGKNRIMNKDNGLDLICKSGKSSTQKRKNTRARHSRTQTHTTKDCTHKLHSRTQTHT